MAPAGAAPGRPSRPREIVYVYVIVKGIAVRSADGLRNGPVNSGA